MDIKLSGSQVNAVVTTGIYCRAGCAGRPNPSNTLRYSSNLAAEAAGFRPCLRCRPDRLTPAPIDTAAPGVVVNSLMLITDGFLDRRSEDELGRAVGISSRQLRRLFLQHIGATPVAVAQSRRAHFARRLLDETDMPVSQIAPASGFRTVRQMNRAMRDIFHFTPTELRARRSRADRLAADGGLKLHIPFTPPFDFATMLNYLAARAIPGVESVSDGVYRRVTTTCGFPGAIEVSLARDGKSLEMVAHLPTFNSLIDDAARVRRLFGIDINYSQGRAALLNDRHLGGEVAARPGITVPGAWDRFETAVRIIGGQQITVKAASELTGRIAREFGEEAPGLSEHGLSRVFPSAAALAEADLASLGMPGARAETIRAFASAVASGRLDLRAYAPLPDLLERLTAITGIGLWTAHLIAMRVLGHMDAFPESDLGLKKALNRLSPGEATSHRGIIDAWRPWRSLAAMYLWTMPHVG
jgi:AraC family transcriptional regulator of adaptative response / DNA-3-methyladenine glycosylase II